MVLLVESWKTDLEIPTEGLCYDVLSSLKVGIKLLSLWRNFSLWLSAVRKARSITAWFSMNIGFLSMQQPAMPKSSSTKRSNQFCPFTTIPFLIFLYVQFVKWKSRENHPNNTSKKTHTEMLLVTTIDYLINPGSITKRATKSGTNPSPGAQDSKVAAKNSVKSMTPELSASNWPSWRKVGRLI